ncbi:MAG: hypothetical protein ACI4DV_00530 [Lachnospiraceae bacterium]
MAEMTVAADVITVEAAVAANGSNSGIGGIFGCPSYHENTPTMIETLKLFLPYFPLHIQKLISMYLKILEMMHMMEMLMNMMNHMDEYQAIFQMFGNMQPHSDNNGFSQMVSGLMPSAAKGFPDFNALKNMMEGSDLVDEFTYVEEPSGAQTDGSQKDFFTD